MITKKLVKHFSILVSFLFAFVYFSLIPTSVNAQSQCPTEYLAEKVVGCEKWDDPNDPYGGYCIQRTLRLPVDCSDQCVATYYVGGCSTWATGCQLQANTHQNIHACGTQGVTSTPTPPGPTRSITATPTVTPPVTAMCQNILAYNNNWVLMTSAQLTGTRAGDRLNYCVTGFANYGSFDMARFTINGVLQPNTTLLRPGTTTDYCQAYTVPANVYNFSIVGEVHHVTAGWVQ